MSMSLEEQEASLREKAVILSMGIVNAACNYGETDPSDLGARVMTQAKIVLAFLKGDSDVG